MVCSRAFVWISFIFIATLLFFISSFGRIHVHFPETVEPKIVHIPKAKSNEDMSCKGLLEGGTLINGNWQPNGCSIHNYTSLEFQQCLINRYHNNQNKTNCLVFVGDSVMRQRYFSVVDLLLDRTIEFRKIDSGYDVFRHPSSYTVIQYHQKLMGSDALNFLNKWNSTYARLQPDFFMLGVNYWEIFDADKKNLNAVSVPYLHNYKVLVGKICNLLEEHKHDVDIVWAQPGPVNFTSISLRKIPNNHWLAAQENYKQRFPHKKDTVVEMYNDLALKELDNRSIRTIKAFYPLGKLFLNSTHANDGVHVSQKPMGIIQQILANYLCNSIMNFNDGTCCRKHD